MQNLEKGQIVTAAQFALIRQFEQLTKIVCAIFDDDSITSANLAAIAEAKRYGQILVALIDSSIRADIYELANIIACLRGVDFVVVSDKKLEKNLSEIKPDVIVINENSVSKVKAVSKKLHAALLSQGLPFAARSIPAVESVKQKYKKQPKQKLEKQLAKPQKTGKRGRRKKQSLGKITSAIISKLKNNRSQLQDLSLVDLQNICKYLNVTSLGNKADLVKTINNAFDGKIAPKTRKTRGRKPFAPSKLQQKFLPVYLKKIKENASLPQIAKEADVNYYTIRYWLQNPAFKNWLVKEAKNLGLKAYFGTRKKRKSKTEQKTKKRQTKKSKIFMPTPTQEKFLKIFLEASKKNLPIRKIADQANIAYATIMYWRKDPRFNKWVEEHAEQAGIKIKRPKKIRR